MRIAISSALRVAAAAIALVGCGGSASLQSAQAGAALVDPNATAETRALFVNLKRLAPDHVLFGHQAPLAYGFTWTNEPGRSDVKDVTGSHPAVYGWDVNTLFGGRPGGPDAVARTRRLRE